MKPKRTKSKGKSRLAANRKISWSWQLKIQLLDVIPTVWRRLVVPETITLPKLHQVFQVALGWTNSHLHEFVIGGVRYSEPDPDFDDELGHVDERGIKLHKALGIKACRVLRFGSNPNLRSPRIDRGTC